MHWSDFSKIVLVQMGDQDMLSIERQGKQIAVTGDIYTSDGDAVHIERNSFETPQNGAFKPKRPDKHTLKVFDKWHNEVLSMRFINPQAIEVSGIFWKPGRQFPLVLSDKGMMYGGFQINAACTGATNVAFRFP